MKVYSICIKNTEEGKMGFGVKVDGEQVDCADISQEDSIGIRGILEAVSMNLYHKSFVKEYGECPVCNIKSVFGDEPQSL